MHFSVITPKPGQERHAAHQMLQGPYRDHQWLWRFFPAEPGSPRDHIYRRADQGHVPKYYVVSARAPTADNETWSVQTRPYQPQLAAGDILEFELCANPVVTRKVDGKHRRHDVVMDAKKRAEAGMASADSYDLMREACVSWLSRQGERHGFDVEAQSLWVDGYLQHVVKDGRLRFSTVDYRGVLKVTDPVAFTSVLWHGLGHAKAFGCGLMLVRRPVLIGVPI